MNLSISKGLCAMALVAVLMSCATGAGETGWITLVDGAKGLENFSRIGEANWTATDGAIQATEGDRTAAFLVSKNSYEDFMIRVEFWVSDDANSGVFLRCQDPGKITDENCYEANIFDQRPDPTYGTGAIVKVAPVAHPMPRAGGKWNTYEIEARGTHLVLILNGIKTVDIHDSKFKRGPFALQWGSGTVRFRKVQIRPL